MVSLSIKRVVSVFILRPNKSPPAIIQPQRHLKNNNNVAYQIALFRRCDTMPTFPNHWAGISGSIEEDDGSPFDAAVRELREETNIGELLRNYYGGSCSGSSSGNVGEEEEEDKLLRKCMKQGLHVDVSSNRSKGAFGAGRIIRVYPFALSLPAEVVDDDKLLPKETEGDNSKSSTVGGGGGGGNNISSRSQYQRYDGVREVDVGVNRSNYSHRRRGRSKGRASMGDDRSMYGNIDDPPLTRAESLLHRSGLRNGGRSRY
mmetsp:Transcript_8966/g.18945  ORF Transcript_8966/g.18945 Transcript_8966/m.18945 type:complete len:260 (+) Transcript_8966:64-843(+)